MASDRYVWYIKQYSFTIEFWQATIVSTIVWNFQLRVAGMGRRGGVHSRKPTIGSSSPGDARDHAYGYLKLDP